MSDLSTQYTMGLGGVLASRTFVVGSTLDNALEDVRMTTQDNVDYHVHATRLLIQSDNFFGGMLALHGGYWQRIQVAEQSTVFNLVLHAVYDLDCAQYGPIDDDIISAVHALHRYGMQPARLLNSSSAFFQLIVSRLPSRITTGALRFYALAGQYDLRDLGVCCSQFLLSLPVRNISGELAQQMGVTFLKCLIVLHCERKQKLRELLSRPPQAHLPIAQCSPARQAALEQAWLLTGAYFIWNASVDLTPVALEVCFSELGHSVTCEMCKAALRDRLRGLVDAWSHVRRTINFGEEPPTPA